DHVIAINRGIDCREALQGFHRGFNKERHKTETRAVMALLENLLVLSTQIHKRLHVDFVEGCQHRSILLSLNQAARNTGPQAGHGHTFFWTLAALNLQSRHLGRFTGSRGCWRRLGSCATTEVSKYIFLGNPTTLATCLNLAHIEIVLFCQLAGRRAEHQILCRSRLSRCGLFSSLGRLGSRSRSSHSTFLEDCNDLFTQDGVALFFHDFFNNAVVGGYNLQHDFVGFDVDDQFVTLNRLARFFMPSGNHTVSDGFRECWSFDFFSHLFSLTPTPHQTSKASLTSLFCSSA